MNNLLSFVNEDNLKSETYISENFQESLVVLSL